MHPALIVCHLKMAGSSQAQVARTLESKRTSRAITPGVVWQVIQGRAKSARVAAEISRVVGMPVAELWPGKYPELEAYQRLQARVGRDALLGTSAGAKKSA